MATPAPGPATVERVREALILRGRLDAAGAGRLWRAALRLTREPRSPVLVVDARGASRRTPASARSRS